MAPKAEKTFAELGVRCDTRRTNAPGHGGRLASQLAENYDAVFTLGGDGTAMEVLGRLAHKGPPVGILPGGTGNVIARTLRVPVSISDAVRALADADEARIDLGRVGSVGEEHRFAIGMGVGLDAAMIRLTPPALKRRFGFFAYVMAATSAVLRMEKFRVRLTVDDERIETEASAVLIMNFGAVLNELITFGDGIRRDDGMLNACVYSPRNVLDAARMLWRMSRKDFSPHPGVMYKSGKEFRLETRPRQPGQADGELIGDSPFIVKVEPRAGRVLVPKEPEDPRRTV